MSKLAVSFLSALLITVVFSGCMCYRSLVEADFGEHNFVYAKSNGEISALWRADYGTAPTVPINPVFMVNKNTERGLILIHFIRPPGADSRVIINSIVMSDNEGKVVMLDAPVVPLSVSFEKKDLPLVTNKGKWGKISKSRAQVEIKAEAPVSMSPYRISINGYYLLRDGTKQRINTTIRMEMRRDRGLDNIVRCWP
jgi:hypothetical protein